MPTGRDESAGNRNDSLFRATGNRARVAFAGPYPGKIIHLPLERQQMLCQRDAFLCATGAIDLSIAFTKRLGAGFFGGEGFILQKMEGTGELFIHSGGATRAVVGARREERGAGRGPGYLAAFVHTRTDLPWRLQPRRAPSSARVTFTTCD